MEGMFHWLHSMSPCLKDKSSLEILSARKITKHLVIAIQRWNFYKLRF